MGKKKRTILTMILSIVNIVVFALLGFIYNRRILLAYGQEVSGLIYTLLEFVSIFSIIEGGFSTAALMAVYNPIVKKEFDKLNDILTYVKKYFLKIGAIIGVSSFLLGIIYINFIDSPIEAYETFILLIVMVINAAFSIASISKYSLLFNGYNEQYIATFVQMLSRVFVCVVAIVLINYKAPIILVYFIYTSYIYLNAIVYSIYFKVRHREIKNTKTTTCQGIKGTKDVFIQKICSTIFTSTDLVLISSGIGLAQASIYNTYLQFVKMTASLLNSVFDSPFNSFGQLINQDREKFESIFEKYIIGMILVVSIVLSTLTACIVDFVQIYTRGVKGLDYNVPIVAILFFCQYYLTILNKPFGSLLNFNQKFRSQNFQTGMAAILNIVISVATMFRFGICGVIFGSVFATLFILVFDIIRCVQYGYIEKHSKKGFLVFFNFVLSIVIITLKMLFIKTSIPTYFSWFIESAIVFLSFTVIFVITNYIVIGKKLFSAINYFLLTFKLLKNKGEK